MRQYILKEYGSWGVMLISYLTGLAVSGGGGLRSVFGLLAISLYINSKQALTLWMRGSGPESGRHRAVFIFQVVPATALMLFLLQGAIPVFLPYALVPVVYIVLLRFAGEHALLTEVSGFALLTLSALMAKFVASGAVDPRLYAAVAVFFIAGVFKVRVQFRKKKLYRLIMLLYLVFAAGSFHLMKIPFMVLLPLTDNALFAVTLYKVKLQTTGWLEVAKGAVFLLLMWKFYPELNTAFFALAR